MRGMANRLRIRCENHIFIAILRVLIDEGTRKDWKCVLMELRAFFKTDFAHFEKHYVSEELNWLLNYFIRTLCGRHFEKLSYFKHGHVGCPNVRNYELVENMVLKLQSNLKPISSFIFRLVILKNPLSFQTWPRGMSKFMKRETDHEQTIKMVFPVSQSKYHRYLSS